MFYAGFDEEWTVVEEYDGLRGMNHVLEILRVQCQTTSIKQISQQSMSHEFFSFPVHIKVIFTLYCSLLSVQYSVMSREQMYIP